MRSGPNCMSRLVIGGLVLLAALPWHGAAWAKPPRGSGPMLMISADRIVGFVPFTVSLYGKLVGLEPGRMEVCRSEVAPLMEPARSAPGEGGAPESASRPEALPQEPPCEPGKVVRAPEGYDYAHDIRFDRPGTYQVRLRMLDKAGKRVLSNPVQVNAF